MCERQCEKGFCLSHMPPSIECEKGMAEVEYAGETECERLMECEGETDRRRETDGM